MSHRLNILGPDVHAESIKDYFDLINDTHAYKFRNIYSRNSQTENKLR